MRRGLRQKKRPKPQEVSLVNKAKARSVTMCIMLLLSAVLYAIVRFKPDTLVIILGVFAIPGFATCSAVLFRWLILPDTPNKNY